MKGKEKEKKKKKKKKKKKEKRKKKKEKRKKKKEKEGLVINDAMHSNSVWQMPRSKYMREHESFIEASRIIEKIK